MNEPKIGVISPPENRAPASPFSSAELRQAFSQPHQLINMVLADYRRLFATAGEKQLQVPLACLLFLITVFFALPYGIAVIWDQGCMLKLPADPLRIGFAWRIPVLYLGSLLICLPSLHIFGAFLELRHNLMQTVALALVITAVAAIFTFGFFPILLFLSATMPAGTSGQALHAISVMLLTMALVIGILQQHRGLIHCGFSGTDRMLIFAWQILLVYITYRMGWFLELV